MIVTSDLHLTEESADLVFGEILPGILEMAVSSVDNDIAILGDIYHIRHRVFVPNQNKFAQWLNYCKYRNVTVRLLPGNHDQVNPSGNNALEVFSLYENVKVYTQPTLDEYGLWVPYRKYPQDLQVIFAQNPTECVLWTHQGMRGALMNNTFRDTKGLPLDILEVYPKVITGHYHGYQVLGNVVYIGSPYQVTAAEAGQIKYVGIWDSLAANMQLREVSWGKKYRTVVFGPDSVPDLSQFSKDDELRVRVEGKNPEEVRKFLSNLGFSRVAVTPVQQEFESRLCADPLQGLEAYARSYVDQFGEGLDPNKLISIWQEISS